MPSRSSTESSARTILRAGAEPDLGGVGAKRREVGRAELVEPLGLVDAPEVVLAEVAQRDAAEQAAVACESSTCPPWPAAQMRAARCTSSPT